MELLALLETQTDKLVYRVRLIRRTLFCLLMTIASLVLCSLALGLSVVYSPALYGAVAFFVIGLACAPDGDIVRDGRPENGHRPSGAGDELRNQTPA